LVSPVILEGRRGGWRGSGFAGRSGDDGAEGRATSGVVRGKREKAEIYTAEVRRGEGEADEGGGELVSGYG